jgi:hypothetical protein
MQAFNGSLLVFKAVVLVVVRPSTRPQLSFFDSKAHGAACIPNESARHHRLRLLSSTNLSRTGSLFFFDWSGLSLG